MATASGHSKQVDAGPGATPPAPRASGAWHGLSSADTTASRAALTGLGALAVLTVIGLAVVASSHSTMLLTWDEPFLTFVVDHRITPLNWFFLSGTLLGGNAAVVPMAAVTAWAVRDRSRAVAFTVVTVMAARLVIEFAMKATVDRPRPDVDTLATYSGTSFPSGHVFGAMAFWGVLPLAVSTLTPDPRARRWATRISVTAVVVVAFSRLYIGAHYPSDIIGALALGTALLATSHLLLHRFRADTPR